MAEVKELQSAARLLMVLEQLAQGGAQGVTEIALATGLSKATTYRHLQTLTSLGYAFKDNTTEQYCPTLRMMQIATALLDHIDIRVVARPHLQSFAEATKETIYFAAAEDTVLRYLDKADAPTTPAHSLPLLGETPPLYCTAGGKALLSTYTEEQVRSVWKRSDIQPYTPHTFVDWHTFVQHLNTIREDGIALCDEEFRLGFRSLAVPLYDYTGNSRFALCLVAPVSVLSEERIKAIRPALLETKTAIERDFGYRFLPL